MGVNQRAQIKMTDEEIDAFLHERRAMSMATIGPDGRIQLVAMWYGFVDGDIGFETKAKSQKVLNLRRDNRLTVMVEDGDTYDTLRGVELAGWGEIIEDPDQLLRLGINVWERYYGPFTEEHKPLVDAMLHKRVLVRLHTEKVV
ncbi:MAG TPA: PPOX class F420-dependent oxidoreductase, partial [Acidimicrobiales bacterium]